MDITRDAIIAAYARTEILPVARTWDTRASLPDGREVACGCALVALCRAAGIDPEPLLAGARREGRATILLVRALATALRVPETAAYWAMDGWDDWPDPPSGPPEWAPPIEHAAYRAGWRAARAVLGGRQED